MRLTVPTPDDRPFEQVITNPAVLIEWLDQLPHIDQESMLTEITEALSHLIRHPDSVAQLPQLLHCYQDAFDELYEQFIANRRSNLNRTDGRKATAVLNLLQKFNREMGFGYNRLLNEFADSFQRDRLVNAITHAMLTHERDILFAFEGYRSVTPIARQALAQLFLFAESRQLTDAITDVSPASAGDILKRVLLLTLADPYILPQQGIWAAHLFLKKHAPMATLKMESNEGILVDIQSSSIRTTMEEKAVAETGNANRYRYIDTHLLCEATRRYVTQAIQDASKLPDALKQMDQIIALQMLRRWYTNWSAPQKRKADRKEKYNRIMSTCGIEAIHHYLLQGSLTERKPIENAYEEDVVLEGSDIYLNSDQLENHPIHEWQLFNLSESGAGLVDEECVSTCFQVGQLVLLAVQHLDDYKQPWMTGIIRRRLEEGKHKNEIGIQFLNGNLHPLEINPLISEASDPSDFSPAFVVNRENGFPLMLTMRGLFKPNRAYNLRKEEQRKRIRAVNLIESSRYFDLFTFATNDG